MLFALLLQMKKLTWKEPLVSVPVDASEVARAQAKPVEVSKTTQEAIGMFVLFIFSFYLLSDFLSQKRLRKPCAR